MPIEPHHVARAMHWIGVAVNLVLLLAIAILGLRLWSWSGDYMVLAGGMPPLDPLMWMGFLTDGTLLQRLAWWGLAWSSVVGSGACALLAVSGLHWTWNLVRSELENS